MQGTSGPRTLMDIRTSGGPPTDAEIAAVDGVLGPPASLWEGGQRTPADDHLARGGHASRSRRDLLLPVLHALQDEVGWVSRGSLEYACRDRKSTRLNSSHSQTSYAVFCL